MESLSLYHLKTNKHVYLYLQSQQCQEIQLLHNLTTYLPYLRITFFTPPCKKVLEIYIQNFIPFSSNSHSVSSAISSSVQRLPSLSLNSILPPPAYSLSPPMLWYQVDIPPCNIVYPSGYISFWYQLGLCCNNYAYSLP